MAENTAIEWCHATFNPWRCTKVSPGCAHCYAETLSKRNPATLGIWGDGGTRVVAAESYWRQPLKWDRQAALAYQSWQYAIQTARSEYDWVDAYVRPRVFCASLADVFEDRPELVAPRERLFKLITDTPNLDWLLLTKRPENVLRLTHAAWCKPVPGHVSQNEGDGRHWHWPRNVWLGVSVEDQQRKARVDVLRQIPATVRFLSVEPLLEDIGAIDLSGIHWMIVGGESGPGARPMHPMWVRSLRDQCQAAGVPFFFKQWGEYAPLGPVSGLDPDHHYPGRDKRVSVRSGVPMDEPTSMFRVGKKVAGRVLDGKVWDEFPAP
jgi:protein gp37